MATAVSINSIRNVATVIGAKMTSRAALKLLQAWAIVTALWIVAVGWETYKNLPPAGASPVGVSNTQREYSRSDIIKIGAAFAFAPPALIFVGGARLFCALLVCR